MIQLTFNISDDLGLKSIVFVYNDSELPSNSETLKNIAFTILKSLSLNKDDVMIQDLLNELDITTSKK